MVAINLGLAAVVVPITLINVVAMRFVARYRATPYGTVNQTE